MKGFHSKPFNSVEHWVSALMSLPEGNFFELLRSVFGNIKTPFNKQKLIEDLIALLSRNEIRKIIASYIDEKDHKLIAALALLNKPALKDMEDFFSGELSGAELHALLINLEERLILYRFRDDEKILRLALNPLLEPVLSPFIADTRPVFPDAQVENRLPAGITAAFIRDHRTMAALLTFIFHEEEFFRTDAETVPSGNPLPEIRKKVLDYGKKNFPSLDFELVVRTLIQLGLFRIEGRSLILNLEKTEEFSNLSSNERQEYWAAGVYLCLFEPVPNSNSDGNSLWDQPFRLAGYRLRSLASFIHSYRRLVEDGKKYPEITLMRLWKLLEMDTGGSEFVWETFLSAMEKAGLLEKREKFWQVLSDNKEKNDTGQPGIAMDSVFSFVLYPEISFADTMTLGAFCSVKEISGTLVRFELSRQSAVRGFDLGMEADNMVKLLDRLSGGRIDESLGWTIKEWENRYKGVSLYQGIFLSLAEEHRYLAEAGPVSCIIEKTLAPGVYLLSSDDRSDAINTLRRAGVDIIAQPPTGITSSRTRQGGYSHGFNKTYFPRLTSSFDLKHFAALSDKTSSIEKSSIEKLPTEKLSTEKSSTEALSIKEKFRSLLEKKKLSKQEREELLARIERRIVLTEAQLEGTSLRYEKLEAKGLDYAGKSVIARQAIEAGSLLEVSWPVSGGNLNCVLGIPLTLEKKEGDSILVLRTQGNAASIPGNTIRVPLGKISLLRRIKQSIFEE